jgi:uncharacterized RDD family membrane protein YckC
MENTNTTATTTLEQDRKTNQDRMLDFLVEMTQTILALAITIATIYISIKGIASETMTNSFFLIVGFYFGKELKNKSISLGNSIYDITKTK